MSHLSPEEQHRLDELAYWIRELFSERGHNISSALDQDPCFRNGERGRSGLARQMMEVAVASATGKVGLAMTTGDGGVRIVQSIDRGYDRRYRVLSAKKQPDGAFRILSSSDKILQVGDDSLFGIEEAWVLAYTLDSDNQIADLFVAQVLDRLEGQPGELVLGPEYMLAGQPPTSGGFEPTDEDLPGYDDEEDEGGVSDAG